MKIKILFLATGIFLISGLYAQQFISKATIEYEMKANIKKTMGNDMFDEMLIENLHQFLTAYFRFTFGDIKSIYMFDRWDAGA